MGPGRDPAQSRSLGCQFIMASTLSHAWRRRVDSLRQVSPEHLAFQEQRSRKIIPQGT